MSCCCYCKLCRSVDVVPVVGAHLSSCCHSATCSAWSAVQGCTGQHGLQPLSSACQAVQDLFPSAIIMPAQHTPVCPAPPTWAGLSHTEGIQWLLHLLLLCRCCFRCQSMCQSWGTVLAGPCHHMTSGLKYQGPAVGILSGMSASAFCQGTCSLGMAAVNSGPSTDNSSRSPWP